jgi:hypothetical protein
MIPADPDPVCSPDPHEINDAAPQATSVGYEWVYFEAADPSDPWSVDTGGADTPDIGASICAEDEDWYFLSTSNLPYTPGWLSIRAFAAGASHCPAWSEYDDQGTLYTHGYDPPSGPENTIRIEVYSAGTLQLVAATESSIGRIYLDTYNGPLNQDLYLRVHGPPAANYSYHFYARVQTDAFEDECEE